MNVYMKKKLKSKGRGRKAKIGMMDGKKAEEEFTKETGKRERERGTGWRMLNK